LHTKSDEDPLFNRALLFSRIWAKLNKQILETAAECVTATNVSCDQTASPAAYEFILNLIEMGAGIQDNDDAILIHAAGLLDTMTKKGMVETTRERGDIQFAEATAELHGIRFGNLGVGAETVYSLKITVCFRKIRIILFSHHICAVGPCKNHDG
jgi:hypothetical protein